MSVRGPLMNRSGLSFLDVIRDKPVDSQRPQLENPLDVLYCTY
jgi:hypothetical protein